MSTINVELVTPEKIEFATDAQIVTIPGSEGDFGVLPGHAPMISNIRPGVVVLEEDGKKREVFVSAGFAEVTPERCTILADESKDVTGASVAEIEELVKQYSVSE